MVTEMDKGIGSIKSALQSKRMWKNSVIIFVSDNGAPQDDDGGSNYPLRGGKGSLFDGGSRVPAFIASPLIDLKGVPYDDLVHFVDLPVTIQSLAGLDKEDEDHQDGLELWDSLNGLEGTDNRESLIYHIDKAQRSKHEIENNPDLKMVLNVAKEHENEIPVLSSAVRFLNYKFIKQVHNLKELNYPHRVVNEFDTVAPPSENYQEFDELLNKRPYDKPLKIGAYDYWLFDTDSDSAERFNLLFDPDFFAMERQMLVDEFDRILNEESSKMIVPQSNLDKKITPIDEMVGTVGSLENSNRTRSYWATGWCNENDLRDANLFKNFY